MNDDNKPSENLPNLQDELNRIQGIANSEKSGTDNPTQAIPETPVAPPAANEKTEAPNPTESINNNPVPEPTNPIKPVFTQELHPDEKIPPSTQTSGVLTNDKKTSKTIIIIAVILFLLSLIGLTFYFVGIKKSEVAETPTPTTAFIPTPMATADPTAGWKVFSSKTLGIEFKIPSQLNKYGILEEVKKSAEKGNYICITFPNEQSIFVKNILAGGTGCQINKFGIESNSIKFEAGQMGNFLFFQDFKYKNNAYYAYWGLGTSYEKEYEIPEDIVTKINENILKLKGKTYSEISIWPNEEQIAAIIKTKNSTYPGLVVTTTLDVLTDKEFDQILSTFKFSEPSATPSASPSVSPTATSSALPTATP